MDGLAQEIVGLVSILSVAVLIALYLDGVLGSGYRSLRRWWHMRHVRNIPMPSSVRVDLRLPRSWSVEQKEVVLHAVRATCRRFGIGAPYCIPLTLPWPEGQAENASNITVGCTWSEDQKDVLRFGQRLAEELAATMSSFRL